MILWFVDFHFAFRHDSNCTGPLNQSCQAVWGTDVCALLRSSLSGMRKNWALLKIPQETQRFHDPVLTWVSQVHIEIHSYIYICVCVYTYGGFHKWGVSLYRSRWFWGKSPSKNAGCFFELPGPMKNGNRNQPSSTGCHPSLAPNPRRLLLALVEFNVDPKNVDEWWISMVINGVNDNQ